MYIKIKNRNDTVFQNVYIGEKNKPDNISICVKTKNKITYFQLFKIEEANPYFMPLHVRYKGIEYVLWCDRI